MQATFLLLALVIGGADVYRWTDADGQVHYSDVPHSGAQRIAIVVPKPAGPPAADNQTDTVPANTDEPAPASLYRSLTITSPDKEQVLWNIGAQLDVSAAVDPPLQPDHVLRFIMDGRMSEAAPGSTTTRFSDVYRGEHSLKVELLNDSGETLVSSPVTRFYVQQTVQAKPPVPTPLPTKP